MANPNTNLKLGFSIIQIPCQLALFLYSIVNTTNIDELKVTKHILSLQICSQ